MPFTLDPEIAAALAALNGGQPPPPPAAVDDIESRRQSIGGFMDFVTSQIPDAPDVSVQDFHTPTPDGHQLLLRWFLPKAAAAASAGTPGPAILYLHGGGFISLTLTHYHKILSQLAQASGVPLLAVDYRLAPEVRAPVPVQDAYTGLVYLHTHASSLGVDRARVGVMGDSAGGGLAASLTHYVKLRGGPAVARQLLVYPMLDDRNTGGDDAHVAGFALWGDADNKTGWGALLGPGRVGAADVGPTEAAGRMGVGEARGLPPAYIDVGELDIFRDECLEYARKLGRAGVSCEFHLYPGAPHVFEGVAPGARVSVFALEQRVRAMRSI